MKLESDARERRKRVTLESDTTALLRALRERVGGNQRPLDVLNAIFLRGGFRNPSHRISLNRGITITDGVFPKSKGNSWVKF